MPILIALIFLTTGCSFWNKNIQEPIAEYMGQDCPAGAWRDAGLADGKRGLPTSKIAKYQKSCKRLEHSPNLSEYRKGREQGLKLYCQEGIGHREGLQQKAYHNVCPEDLEEKFLFQYNLSRKIVKLRREISTLKTQIYGLKNDLVGDILSNERKVQTRGNLASAEIKEGQLRKKLAYLQAQVIAPSKSLLERIGL